MFIKFLLEIYLGFIRFSFQKSNTSFKVQSQDKAKATVEGLFCIQFLFIQFITSLFIQSFG